MQLFCPPAGAQAGFRSVAHHAPAAPPPQSITEQLASKAPLADFGRKPGCAWKEMSSAVKGARATAVAVRQLVLHDVLHDTA